MRNPVFLWPILAGLVLAEWYGFLALQTLTQHLAPGLRLPLLLGYWAFTLGAWGVALWAGATRRAGNARRKGYLVSLPLILLAGKLVALVPLLIGDLLRVGRWGYGWATHAAGSASPLGPRSELLTAVALVLGAIPFLALLWGMVRGGTAYRVRRLTLRYPNLPVAFDGFKVLQISDLHTGSFSSPEPLQRAVALINEQQADVVLMTGDLVNNVATEVEPHLPALSRIKAKSGVFSSLGNHDYGDYVRWETPAAKRANLARLVQNHARMGWHLLNDESVTLRRGDAEIAILGVQNWSNQASFPKYGNLAKAHAASGDAPFKILLSHDPTHWQAQVLDYPDIALTLSGHTHGMQFGLNLPFLKWSPVQYVYRQWAGLYEQGRQRLYVNVGLGFLGYPGRVGFLPEITVLELRRG